jgi:hypothetical protein
MDIDGDIELAKNNAQLFSQTLSFTDPTAEDITQNELVKVRTDYTLLSSSLLIVNMIGIP